MASHPWCCYARARIRHRPTQCLDRSTPDQRALNPLQAEDQSRRATQRQVGASQIPNTSRFQNCKRCSAPVNSLWWLMRGLTEPSTTVNSSHRERCAYRPTARFLRQSNVICRVTSRWRYSVPDRTRPRAPVWRKNSGRRDGRRLEPLKEAGKPGRMRNSRLSQKAPGLLQLRRPDPIQAHSVFCVAERRSGD